MAPTPGSNSWWLDRLYTRLRLRRPLITEYENWYIGRHPSPTGKAEDAPLLDRIMSTVGLNGLAIVTDAARSRLRVDGFTEKGKSLDDFWDIWQGNRFDVGSEMLFQERMALSRAFAMVDPEPNAFDVPTITAEHPSQCIVERDPRTRERLASLKVWLDDTSGTMVMHASVQTPADVVHYAANVRIDGWSMRPSWEVQAADSGRNELGEVSLIEFRNNARLLAEPTPEFWPAVRSQRRLNKTLLDRMAMQDLGAFQAKWATGIDIPIDPITGLPVQDFEQAVDSFMHSTNPDAKFGQFNAEDIRQMLLAADADLIAISREVPTPSTYLAEVRSDNVSAEQARSGDKPLITRVLSHQRHLGEDLEDLARLGLKAAGKSVPNAQSLQTVWQQPEFRTENDLADAGIKARAAGMPDEVVWVRYFGATPEDAKDWATKAKEQAAGDPLLAAASGRPKPLPEVTSARGTPGSGGPVQRDAAPQPPRP